MAFTWTPDDLSVPAGFSRLQTLLYELQQVAKTQGFDLFATVSAANSAGGTDGDKAVIVGDSASNNGYYERTGGAWIRRGPLGGIGLDVSTYMSGMLEDENASAALTTLGIGATGAALFAAASQSAARTAIGATTTGSALITATDQAAGRTAIGAPSTAEATTGAAGLMPAADKAKTNALYAASTIASASTIDIGAVAAESLTVTGTTTITGLGTAPAGVKRSLEFAAALTLTHNATSLILPGRANIKTAAGDTAHFRSLGSGNWRCTGYTRADGRAVYRSVPEWVPVTDGERAAVLFGLRANQFWQDGIVRELSDYPTIVGGGYVSDAVDWWNGEFTAAVDFIVTDPAALAGTLFGMTGTSNTPRIDIGINATYKTPSFVVQGLTTVTGPNALTSGEHRIVLAAKSATSAKYIVDGGALTSIGVPATFDGLTDVNFGALAWSNDQNLVGAVITRIVIYPKAFSDAVLQSIAAFDTAPERHISRRFASDEFNGVYDLSPGETALVDKELVVHNGTGIVRVRDGQAPSTNLTVPSWVPTPGGRVPYIYYNLTKGLLWRDGGVRSIDDEMIVTAEGAHQLVPQISADLVSDGATYSIDYHHPDPSVDVPTGTFLSTSTNTSGAGRLMEFVITDSSASKPCRLYIGGQGFSDFLGLNYGVPTSLSGSGAYAIGGLGINRCTFAFPSAGAPRSLVNNMFPLDHASGPTGLTQPRLIQFKGRVGQAGGDLVNSTLHAAAIWDRQLTEAELQEYGKWNDYGIRPIHFEGDSFLNNHHLMEAVAVQMIPYGYIPLSQWGKGGTSIEEAAERWAITPDHYDCTLLLMEGGFDGARSDDPTPFTDYDIIAAIRDMVDRLDGHEQWAWVGSVRNDSGRVEREELVERFAREHYIGTMEWCQSYAADATEYDALVAAGEIPASLRADTIHLNAAGNQAFARRIVSWMQAHGYLPRARHPLLP